MNNDDNLYYIWLTQIKGVGTIIGKKLLNIFKSPEKIYNLKIDDLLQVQGIGRERAKRIFQSKELTKAKVILKSCSEKNIKISNINDDIFPDSMKKYDNSPILFYYKGYLNRDLLGVAIVGSRRCTEYGKKVAIEAAEFLATNNIPVISGMAKGIDSYSHTACLKIGGFTAAILGCSVDICYPKEHVGLMKKIIENGVVISKYPPDTSPKPEYFPERNKIICALSSKVLIAEAGGKSGALITAEYAINQKKDLYVASGNIYCKEFKGSNKLISEGAKIYLSSEQLLDKENIIILNQHKNNIKEVKNSSLQRKIIEVIKCEKLTIDEIALRIGCDIKELVNELFILEINGKIQSFKGGRYG